MGKNLELVREAFDAFLGGDVERALGLVDPDIECVRVPPLPDPQIYHGSDGVLQMYADWTADFDEFEMEALEFTEIADRVLVEVIQRGRGKASGVTVTGRFWMFYTVAGGKITRLDAYLTREQAIEPASPPP
jgi:ketosteroid isomerase-like protein